MDGVTGHSFLYLLPDYRPALAEAVRVLRPGGDVVFLEPFAGRPDWGWLRRQGSLRLLSSLSLWRLYSGRHRRFSVDELRRAFEQAGLTNVRTEVTLRGFGLLGRGRKPDLP